MTLTESLSHYFKHITATCAAISKYFTAKLTGTVAIATYSFFFNVENQDLLLAIGMLIIFDCITGMYAAKKRKEAIESRKVIKSAFKLLIYGLLISAMHLVDMVMSISDFNFNLEIVIMGFLAATEGISILENVGKCGYAIPSKLLNLLTNFTKKEELPSDTPDIPQQ